MAQGDPENGPARSGGASSQPEDDEATTLALGEDAKDSLLSEIARRMVVPATVEPWPDRAAIEATNRYRVEELLGEGGMARVYRAFDSVLGRTVALKLLREAAPETVQRFFREARAQAKVEHEHVCRIYEVGELSGRPFIAMQYIAGTTLRDGGARMSLASKVRIVRDIALGVHAAHRVGLIHRDIKPSNILLEEREGAEPKPYVVDFGIARDVSKSGLTMTGQSLGTPQYMSPEQALGRPENLDRRTDVYSLGATLYELLCGGPPFSGQTVTEVLLKVTAGEPVPLRKRNPRLPIDLDTIVMKCLRPDPLERYDSARALAEDLQRHLDGEPLQARRTSVWYRIRSRVRKNKPLTAALGAAILATSGVAIGVHVNARRERAAHAGALAAEAERALAEAHSRRSDEDSLRGRAFSLFDAEKEQEAEVLWTQARAVRSAVELAYARAGRALEAALAWDPDRARARERLAGNLLERARYAERNQEWTRRDDLIERLKVYDDGGAHLRRWEAPAVLTIASDPAGAEVWISKLAADARGRLSEGSSRRLGVTPLSAVQLAPGSHLFRFRAPGRAPVRYPILLGREESVEISLELPEAARIPEGFVYVPPGRFLLGAEEEGRRVRLAPPLHEARTGPYLIGRTPVTVGEWLEFLNALPPAERSRRVPSATGVERGSLSLREIGRGVWEYRLHPLGAKYAYVARTGEPLRYSERRVRAIQDWTRFPVTGISVEDAEAYAAWLDRSGRLPGARLCSGTERERAARGADAREYPQGRPPDPSEANLTETYGRGGMGLDEVGSHPASRSPFGVDDLVGNASEWTVQRRGGPASDHGAAYSQELFARTMVNARNPAPRSLRNPGIGMRLCATFSARPAR
jgi:formylglycine-generating enzyme required for sulfatase activity/predicted Ser/Thr protein kinase